MMNDKLTEIQGRISSIQKELIAIEKDFREIIKDTSIPLDERWSVFKYAPSELKHAYSWVQHFSFEESFQEAVGTEFTWYDEFYAERHQTIDTFNILDHLEERRQHEGDEVSTYSWVTQDVIDKFKEEVLALAMLSFVYDW
ncbi:hypothetical protein RsoM2USA_36 [Ralstonia phage RsoM2USA]|nr:hypothetical protein RsoM2USA_36 [Ralstonia phage RsoM2USA]